MQFEPLESISLLAIEIVVDLCMGMQQRQTKIPVALSTFEERQTALFTEVPGRGMSCNGNEIVQEHKKELVHVQPPLEDSH